MAQTILGLDVGAGAIGAVLLESAYRGFRVKGAVSAAVEPPAAGGPSLRERQAAALARLLSERGWRPDACVAAFPGAAVAAHVVTLPFTDPRRIEQTIPFELEAQIPHDLAEAAWDWQPLGVRAGSTDLWVGVTTRAGLADFLALLGGAGVDPRVVVPPAAALAALTHPGVLAAGPQAPGEPPPVEAVLDLDQERTHLCLAAGGTLVACRSVALGEAAVARALARELGHAVPGAEPGQAAAGPGAAPPAGAPDLAAPCADPRAAEALPRALAPLLRELRATLRAWRAREGQRPVARAWLAGSLARLPGLAELVAAEVGGPARPLELAGPAAEGVPADAAPGLALALSAALRGHLGGRASRLNLRRGDAAYTRDMEQLKQRVGRLAVYAALVLLLAGASWGVRLFALSRQELLVDRALCEAEEKVLGRCLGSVEEAVSALRGRGIPGAGIPKASAVDVLGELAQRTPEGVKVRFDRIDITDKKLHLQGTTEAPENVDKVVEALKGSRCFADARSGGARKRGTEAKFEFSIDSALGCVGGKE